MHFEFLVEDRSGAKLLETLIPKIFATSAAQNTWRLHPYKGIGRIPTKGLVGATDPAKRILLDQLPRILRGLGKTPGIDFIFVIVDADSRDCAVFLAELKDIAEKCGVGGKTLFRLAIEETEAWYLGDLGAVMRAYPRAKRNALKGYAQDSICGTWELLADAVYPGGASAIKKAGWPLPGQIKYQWAEKIGAEMDLGRNVSMSFRKFLEGLRRVSAAQSVSRNAD